MAVLIVVQYQLGSIAEDLGPGIEKLILMSRHKSLGVTILLLAILRLGWRLANRVPPPPARPAGLRYLAGTSHLLLYGLLIALPLTGWLASSAANASVSWWGLLTLPDLIHADEARFEALAEIHEGLSRALVVLVVVHSLAALLHHFVLKDDVLRRMLPWPARRGGGS